MAIMRAVVVHVRDEELAERRTKGLDRWDEMWEGVLHMTPAPSVEHQRILDAVIEFLRPRLRESGRGSLFSGINVFRDAGGVTDYRIPDLTFIATGREHVLRDDGVRGEGPDAVLEIRSPEDETYDKLPFYAALGVREVIVCHRDTKAVEIFRLAGSQYVALQRDAQDRFTSDVLGVRFRRVDGQPPRLRIDDAGDAWATVEI
jgi:Uma2 family endonuclease